MSIKTSYVGKFPLALGASYFFSTLIVSMSYQAGHMFKQFTALVTVQNFATFVRHVKIKACSLAEMSSTRCTVKPRCFLLLVPTSSLDIAWEDFGN